MTELQLLSRMRIDCKERSCERSGVLSLSVSGASRSHTTHVSQLPYNSSVR